MPDPTIPTVTGCGGGGLRTAFDRAKEVIRSSDTEVCMIDLTGLGEPQFAVFASSEWEEWVDDPGAVMSQDNVLPIPASAIGDALADVVKEQMSSTDLPRN